MRPLSLIIADAERGLDAPADSFARNSAASALAEVLPFLKMLARQDTAPAQKCLDVMFAALSRCHAGEAPKDREECMEWARRGLRQAGIDVIPMGLSHAVIRKDL